MEKKNYRYWSYLIMSLQRGYKDTIKYYTNDWKNSISAQQSVHLTLGILRKSQAVFYALSFFQLDGFAVPAPAQVG
jgi:hypothetical protein